MSKALAKSVHIALKLLEMSKLYDMSLINSSKFVIVECFGIKPCCSSMSILLIIP